MLTDILLNFSKLIALVVVCAPMLAGLALFFLLLLDDKPLRALLCMVLMLLYIATVITLIGVQ